MLDPASHWADRFREPGRRMNRALDRVAVAARLEALLREQGAPIAYQVFGREFLLCAPALPGVQGDPDIMLVLGDAQHDLFFVAQVERGGLSDVSTHDGIHAALGDFLRRAVGGARDLDALMRGLVVHGPIGPAQGAIP